MTKTMRRWLTLFLVASMPLAGLACGEEPEDPTNGDDSGAYALSVSDQNVSDDPSTVTVDWVENDGEGVWTVIHADNDGEPGDILGWTWVEGADERVQNVEVSLDSEASDGQTLWAMLHTDDGNGEWDDAETDPPAEADGEVVQGSFEVSVDDGMGGGDTPAISVEDQTIASDSANWVAVSEATLDESGFVVIHADDGDSPGDVLGASDLLEAGTSSDVSIELSRDVEDGETLWAMLHYDDGNGEWDDLDTDPPVQDENDEIVMSSFEVSVEDDGGGGGGASVSVSNQVVAADAPNRVRIDEVSYDSDGFLVVHADDGGSPGEILGASDLLAGGESPHEDVWVELSRPVDGAETLHAMIHADSDGNGEWNADNDAAVEADGNVVVESFDTWTPGVEASDKTLNADNGDLSTVVTVDSVVSQGAGWLVIHENGCDNFGGVLGWASVEGWDNENVTVELSAPAADGGANADLCAMLHTDDGNGEYDFDASDDEPSDVPVTDQNDEVVMSTFNVSVTEGTPAVRITLGADGSNAYTVDSVEPGRFEGHTGTMDDDVTFDLRSNWRYEFENTVTGNHPFEFVTSGPGASGDTVHLSQASDPALEGNNSINWWESGSTFRFTVGTGFSTVDTYRCNAHPESMRGPVSTQ